MNSTQRACISTPTSNAQESPKTTQANLPKVSHPISNPQEDFQCELPQETVFSPQSSPASVNSSPLVNPNEGTLEVDLTQGAMCPQTSPGTPSTVNKTHLTQPPEDSTQKVIVTQALPSATVTETPQVKVTQAPTQTPPATVNETRHVNVTQASQTRSATVKCHAGKRVSSLQDNLSNLYVPKSKKRKRNPPERLT